MENPWANAWDESHKSQPESTTTSTTSSAWALKFQSASVNNDREADIATPSWTSGPAVKWNEPTDNALPLWGTEEKGGWSLGTSSYESIDFGIEKSAKVAEADVPDSLRGSQGSELESDNEDEIPGESQADPDSNNEDPSVDDVSRDIGPWTPSRGAFVPSDAIQPSEDEVVSSIVPPGSPDGFGTFETGSPSTKPDADPWSSPRNVSADAGSNEWGAAWAPSDSGEDTETEKGPVLDEWEAARRQKEIQDRYVPPELLSSILKNFEEVSKDLWVPSVKSGQHEKEVKEGTPKQKGTRPDPAGRSDKRIMETEPDEEGARHEHAGDENADELEGLEKDDVETQQLDGLSDASTDASQSLSDVESLETLSTKIIPPLTLPTFSPFLQTFTCKRTADAVRLTRNAYITRSGPMAKYLQTKGSIAWEAAVKSRVERNLDEEVLPVGWRIVEKEKELPSPVEMKKKTTGGILSSFFGRRAATPPVTGENAQERPASPRTSISSPRPSTDSAAKNGKVISSSSRDVSPAPSVVKPSSLAATDVTVPSGATEASSAAITGYADAGSPDLFQDTAPQPAPSAVSRFLERFSRNRSSPRNSLALSSDDLEFLSDIVPSVNDDVEDSEEQLKALSNMIGSPPLPNKLPPPRASPQSTSIGRSSPVSGELRPSNATLSQPPLIPSPLAPTPVTTSQLLPSPASPLTSPISPASSTSSSAASSMITSGRRAGTPSQLAMKGRDKVSSSAYALPAPHSRISSSSSTTQKRVTPVAIMSSSSSSKKPPAEFPAIGFLPPPPSVPVRPPSSTAAPSSLLMNSFDSEPGPSSSKTGNSSIPPAQSAMAFDDDDFADFHSASIQSPQSGTNLQNSFSLYDTSFTSATSDQNLFSATLSAKSKTEDSTDLFDDFDDFVSSPGTLRTPSPPKPPTKSPMKAPATRSSHPMLQIIPPSFISTTQQLPSAVTPEERPGQVKVHQRKVSREEHRRTQSLMESAAAQKGRWPAALPSPLPPILSPPPGERAKQGSDRLDIFSDDDSDLISPSLETHQSKSVAGLGLGFPSSVSSPAVLPPPYNASITSTSMRNGTLPPVLLPPAPQQQQSSPMLMDLFGSGPDTSFSVASSNAPSASTTAKSGGLSAQDLSFFEGL